ncbi:Aldo-keto reductase [Favolaschia claudopus]|uniref:Aldo-keto reductase n=1 Tax=Favolaschia claudopus TaxID=2862362 RepID=A0AAW0BQ00_9AGAR
MSSVPYVALTSNQSDVVLPPTNEAPSESSYTPIPSTSSFPSDPRLEQTSWYRPICNRVQEFLSLNAGLLLVTGAQAVFSLVNVAVKVLQNLDEPMLVQKVPHPFIGPEGVRSLLVLRGVTGFLGLNGTYFALQYLSLSDVTVIEFLVPMGTAMTASVFLKESFSRREALASLCSLFGVVLIARPHFLFGSSGDDSRSTDEKHRMLAIGMALSGVIGLTGAMTTIRAIGQRAHPLHLLASFSVHSVFAASIVMAILRQPVVIPTLLGFAAQLKKSQKAALALLLMMGFQREAAGRASMGLYTQIIFATVLEHVFFHTLPTLLSVLGTGIIMSAAIYVALTKKKSPEEGKPQSRREDTIDPQNDISLEEGLLQNFKAQSETEEVEYDSNSTSSQPDRQKLNVLHA